MDNGSNKQPLTFSHPCNCAQLEEENQRLNDQVNRLQDRTAKLQNTIDTITSSVKFQIADELVKASVSFKALLELPKTFFSLYRKGRKSMAVPVSRSEWVKSLEPFEQAGRIGECVLFMPTNGAGLGHLTRLMAIAKRVRQLSPDTKIIFFTTSVAMPLLMQEGFLGYYLPSKVLLPPVATDNQWNQMLRNQLDTILDLHAPSTLVFDGTYPYDGLVSAMAEASNLRKVWVQRGERKQISAEKVADRERYFDQIIIPGEAGEEQKKINEKKHTSAPVIFLDEKELLECSLARKLLLAPESSKVVYVQLGAGNINDTSSTISILLSLLRERKDIYVVLGESLIGKRLNITIENGITIRDYPNSKYFKAFDLAISAAGYNSFHELMYFCVPTIFVPNEQTITDDQTRRALKAEQAGAAFVVTDSIAVEEMRQTFMDAITKGLIPEVNQKMRQSAAKLAIQSGADQIAAILVDNPNVATPVR